MQDAFLTGSGALFNISLGTWNTNDLPMSVGWLAVQAGATLNAGVSTISLLTTTLPTLTSFSSSANVNGANATWVIAGASAIDRTFGTATGRSYGAVVYTVPNSTGKLIMTGSNTIGTLSVSGGARTVSFTAGSTTTITNWNVNGSAGNPITINSTTPGTQATIKPAVTALVPFQSDFLSLKDILAQNSSGGSGLRNWYAGNFSVDSGNNTGWIFGPVPGVWGFIPI